MHSGCALPFGKLDPLCSAAWLARPRQMCCCADGWRGDVWGVCTTPLPFLTCKPSLMSGAWLVASSMLSRQGCRREGRRVPGKKHGCPPPVSKDQRRRAIP